LFLQQFSIVAIKFGPRVFFDRAGSAVKIDIAKRNNVGQASGVEVANVSTTLSTDADTA
jgi:hypothetical protein